MFKKIFSINVVSMAGFLLLILVPVQAFAVEPSVPSTCSTDSIPLFPYKIKSGVRELVVNLEANQVLTFCLELKKPSEHVEFSASFLSDQRCTTAKGTLEGISSIGLNSEWSSGNVFMLLNYLASGVSLPTGAYTATLRGMRSTCSGHMIVAYSYPGLD